METAVTKIKIEREEEVPDEPDSAIRDCSFVKKEKEASGGATEAQLHDLLFPNPMEGTVQYVIEEVRMHSCLICNEVFTCQSALVQHSAVHRVPKSFLCFHCPKTFSIKDHLLRHTRMKHQKEIISTSSPTETSTSSVIHQIAKFHMKMNKFDKEKSKSGRIIPINEREMVINIYNEVRDQLPNLPKHRIVEDISQTVGFSLSSIWKILKDYESNSSISEPTSKRIRANVMSKLNAFAKTGIRRKINEFFLARKFPNAANVFEAVNSDETLPDLKKGSFYKFLNEMNFIFVKHNKVNVLREKEEIVQWRRNYVQLVQRYRKEGRTIYYLDETEIEVKYSSKSKHFIIAHVASAEGFVSGALHWYELKRKPGDKKMTEDVFLEYFRKVLPLLKDGSVIVMDDAAYHSVKTENIAEKSSKTVLRPPSYHGEFNAIELAWPIVRSHVEENYTSLDVTNVQELISEAIAAVTADHWGDFFLQTVNEEQRSLEIDAIADSMLSQDDA